MSDSTHRWTWVVLVFVLCTVGACGGKEDRASPTKTGAGYDEASLWGTLPLPADAERAEVGKGFDVGLSTRMIEPELFDFYASWLSEHGWREQAPTEAMVTLPHQTWRKDEVELLIEIRGLDDRNRTVVWLRAEEQ